MFQYNKMTQLLMYIVQKPSTYICKANVDDNVYILNMCSVSQTRVARLLIKTTHLIF